MITRSGQDFIERQRDERRRLEAARSVIARSPRIARTARKFVLKLVYANHQCYGPEICSFCHHQEEVTAAMVMVARSHARHALRGHVFDNEIDAAIRRADKDEPKRRKRGTR